MQNIEDQGRQCLKCLVYEQGRKRPLDTPKKMIERREREGEREKERQKERYREGGRDKRDRQIEREREREREVKGIER